MAAFRGPATMFSSHTFSIDESKLCFNKTHFNREDFNVERFMNLARQKADLKTIQQDLRLYLKSVQNSMIELINDDYADFVHLSSNLVSLQNSLIKVEQDLNRNWLEFGDSTKESIGMAERIEIKCDELYANRRKQSELRDRISYLCAIEKLSSMIQQPFEKCSVLWLQKAANFVVEMKSTSTSVSFQLSDEERSAERILINQLENILCFEGVRSASSDCQNLPLILSILHSIDGVHTLTAHLVSGLLYPMFVENSGEENAKAVDQSDRLEHIFNSVKKMRETWADALGEHKFSRKMSRFLDDTLLTFVVTFIDKCMGTVAVPSDTGTFHKCFLATQQFINEWPSASTCRTMLKSIRDKFNLLVYFKLETQRFSKKIDQFLIAENIGTTLDIRNNEGEFRFEASSIIFTAIEHVWSDDVYLSQIIDKLWDFTLKMLLKHYNWIESVKKISFDKKRDWTILLLLRGDAEKFHQEVFNFALENIWGKLHDISVETGSFGQCLTKHGRLIADLCEKIDSEIAVVFADEITQELNQVSDVPKQYRWTKRALPREHSKYAATAVEMLTNFQRNIEEQGHPNVSSLMNTINHTVFRFFVEKATEVQDSVEATTSSLSRFKRKATPVPECKVSDDEKIKLQIYHDGLYLLENAEKLDVSTNDLLGLQSVVDRFDVQKEHQNGSLAIQRNHSESTHELDPTDEI